MSHAPAPTTAAERHEILDALRGLALFGIFVMNLRALAGWYAMGPNLRAAVLANPADRTLLFLHDLLLHGKFYTLFSLLFGIGFALQLGRAAGPDFLARYRRRLAILLGFGMIHMTFLWEGDILAAYALCGFALLPFRQLTDRRLLAWAAFFIILPVAWYALMLLNGFDPGRRLEGFADTLWAATGNEDVDPLVVLGQGTVMDILRWNVFGPFYRFGAYLSEGRLFKILGVFLAGLWAGRRLVAGTLLEDERMLRRVLFAGLAIGLPANIAFAQLLGPPGPPTLQGLVRAITYALGVAPLGFAYAAGFALLWKHGAARRALHLLSPAGRVALSTYISQTLIGLSLYGIGFGIVGTLGPAEWTLFAAAVFAGQVLLARVWLRNFRYGPLEWLWRRITYGTPLPMRLAARQVAVSAGQAHAS